MVLRGTWYEFYVAEPGEKEFSRTFVMPTNCVRKNQWTDGHSEIGADTNVNRPNPGTELNTVSIGVEETTSSKVRRQHMN